MKLLAATLMSLSLTAPALGQQSQPIEILRSGSQPSRGGPPENFTGTVRVDPLFTAKEPSRVSGAYVTFSPGARSAWHTHPVGQTLIVTAGVGLVQRWGGPIEEMRVGDVVRIPPGAKHWHGASPGASMTHIAIQEQIDGKSVDWMEQVPGPVLDSPAVRRRARLLASHGRGPESGESPRHWGEQLSF